MLSSHVHSSPAVATPLEPCRVAPYVNVPRLPSLPFPPPGTFSAFDPALLTAAHQVSAVCMVNLIVILLVYFDVSKTLQSASSRLVLFL